MWRRFRRDSLAVVAFIAVATTVAMIVLGSTVRVTNSGMGCRSWPLCNGQLGPIDHFHALLEQSHRYLATVVSVFVVLTGVLAWRDRARRPGVLAPALAAVGALVVQVALGALTVLAHNAGWTVGLHLVCAEILLALLAVAAFRAVLPGESTGRLPDRPAHRRLVDRQPYPGDGRRRSGGDPSAIAAVALLLATIVAGTLVVDGGAEEACPAWPLCPAGSPGHLVALQLVHRGFAAAAGIAVLVWSVRLWRRHQRRVASAVLVALLALQGAAGGITAVLEARAGAADLHLALGTLLWLAAVVLAVGGSPALPALTDAGRPREPLAATGGAPR